MDPRRNYLDTTDAATELISRVKPVQLDGPGLGTWDLRSLIGHTSRAMSTVVTYLNRPVSAVTCADAVAYYVWVAQTPDADSQIAGRGVRAGTSLGEDVLAGFAAQAREVRRALDA
ncbi:MAG: maleylpyruvate isomerase N-terminal domain-containing protein, partial [Micrococcales bacterium]|nr:maleylpyruvate isomerase N-terminal domain-containing protein [Micrococcales bacterium]